MNKEANILVEVSVSVGYMNAYHGYVIGKDLKSVIEAAIIHIEDETLRTDIRKQL